MTRRKEQFHGHRDRKRPVPPSLRVMRFLFSCVGGLFPRLLGRWAYALWFRTRRFPESAAGTRAARDAAREILTVGNLPVAVYRWGREGPTVLFVHGWSGRGSQVAAFVQPLLAAGFQVLAVDAPGHGETPGDRTNILECVRVVQAVSRRYGPLQGAITHSFGGMVLARAMQQGVNIERVVCISAPADMESLLRNFAQTLALHPAVVGDLRRRVEQRFDDNYWTQMSTTNNVKQLAVPALVIHDEQDISVPWVHGRRIADAWPNALFLMTTGLGHGRILRDAAVVEAAVAFIRGEYRDTGTIKS